MYDELIKKLYHCANEVFCNKCPYSPGCAGEKTIIREAADAIEGLSHAVDQMTEWRKNRWIPVTERLPEGEAIAFNALKGSYGYGEYLIGFIGEAKNIESDTGFLCENEVEILTSVTHWMPLPQPPEDCET